MSWFLDGPCDIQFYAKFNKVNFEHKIPDNGAGLLVNIFVSYLLTICICNQSEAMKVLKMIQNCINQIRIINLLQNCWL